MDFTDADSSVDESDPTPTTVSDTPPEPHEASIEDVEAYTAAFLQANPRATTQQGGTDDPTLQLPTSKALNTDDAEFRSEFPWLYDPSRGVRWDFDPIELRVLAQENAWVEMLVQTITKELAETSWTISAVDDETETQKRLNTHPDERQPVDKAIDDPIAQDIHDLLAQPAPDHDWHDLVEMWGADLLEVGSLTGVKAFDQRYYTDDGEELTADPEAITPQAIVPSAPEVWTKDYRDKTGLLDGYVQFDRHSTPGAGGGSRRGTSQTIFFDKAEVVWSDHSPRTNRAYGTPPTLLVKDFVQSLDLAVTQEQQYLSRGSIPSGAWVFEEWDRNQVKEWKSENAENIKGKPHKSLMFAGQGGDVRFEPMSMNFKDLEFTERMRWYARVVASAFQVPTAVVGLEPEQVNYATFQGERENFEANTLGPYLQQFERVINNQIITPHWGDDYRFEFVPGMSESTRQMISNRVGSEFDKNLTTRNEARRELGREPVPNEQDGFKDEVVEGSDENPFGDMAASLSKEFSAELLAIRPPENSDIFADDVDTIGIGVDFPNDAVYVDWNNEVFPDPLDNSHVSIYGSVDDLKTATGNVVESIGTVDAEGGMMDVAESVVTNAKAEYDVGGETIDLTPPDYMIDAAEAAAEAGDEGLIPSDCGTGVGDRRRDQILDDEIGPDVVDEMATYLTSHAEDVTAEGTPAGWSDDEWGDCGNAQYAKWGGVGDGRAMEWAQRNSDRVAELRGEEPTYKKVQKEDFEDPCWEGYTMVGTKPNGDPRCVPDADVPDAEEQSADFSKAEADSDDAPLRNTDEYAMFDVQPGEIEALHDKIAPDVGALYEEILSDDEIQAIIDELAAESENEADGTDGMEKSLTGLSRRLRELLADSDVAEKVKEAVQNARASEAREAIEAAARAESEDVDPDPIMENVLSRDLGFADRLVDRVESQVREAVADGWAEGKNSLEIRDDIADIAGSERDWGTEKIARQELQIAAGEARNEFADEIGKIEVWQTSEDERVRDAHEAMAGLWKRPSEQWEVDYSAEGRGVETEKVPGQSEPGIGCRCFTLLRDIDEVDLDDHAGV